MFNPFNTPTSLRVNNLQLVETGTYNPQYRRPYMTQVNGTTLNSIVETAVRGQTTSISPEAIGKHATGILIPSAMPEAEAFMPNGWTTPRMRFSLTLDCDYSVGGKIRIHLQGYTEYSDLSLGNNFDHNMRFFINSIMTTSFMNTMTAFGPTVQEHVRDCSHLLVNQNVSNVMDLNGSTSYSMRPQDVFGTMQHSFVNDAAAFAGNDMLVDTRCVLRGTPAKSNRKNAMSSTYVADMINGFTSSLISSNFENTESEVLGKAISSVCEDSTMSDPFLNAMMGIMGNNQISNTFTYKDLLRLDPNTDSLTNLVRVTQNQIGEIHQFGQTANWGGADRMTHAATYIVNSVPSIMASVGVTRLGFTATNAGGSVEALITSIKSITINAETEKLCIALTKRIINEVCEVISFSNQSYFYMMVECNMMGDTTVDIQIETSGVMRFVAPTFTDSSYCPVITNNMTRTTDVARDLNGVMDSIREGILENTSHYQTY